MRGSKYLPLILLRVAPIFAQAVFLALLLTFLGVQTTGRVAFFLAGLSVFRGLGSLGLDLEVLRVSSRSVDSNGMLSRTLLRGATRKALCFSFISVVVTVLAGLIFPHVQSELLAIAAGGFFGPTVSVLVSFLRPSQHVIKSQAIDAIGTALFPALACSLLTFVKGGSLINFAIIFSACTLLSVVILAFLARQSSSTSFTGEEVQLKSLRTNAPAQVLVAANSRLPVIATGLFSNPAVVTYVDLGSKIQMIGATVAWLFGVIQSPTYARDGDFLSRSSLKLIAKSAKWSCFATVLACVVLSSVAIPFAENFQLDSQKLVQVVIAFTFVAITESWFVSAGYGLAMTRQSTVIVISVAAQITISLVGIFLAAGQLLLISEILLLSAGVRLVLVLMLTRKEKLDDNKA